MSVQFSARGVLLDDSANCGWIMSYSRYFIIIIVIIIIIIIIYIIINTLFEIG